MILGIELIPMLVRKLEAVGMTMTSHQQPVGLALHTQQSTETYLLTQLQAGANADTTDAGN